MVILGQIRAMTPVALTFLMAVGSSLRLVGAPLDSLDLASLYGRAELVVLVEDFTSAGPTRPGTGIVKKVYAGEMPLGNTISIIPWSVDFTGGVASSQGTRSSTCVFFLKRQKEGNFWGAVTSGVRVILEDKVLGVTQAGPSTYWLTPAVSEATKPLPTAKKYGYTELQNDIYEARSRVLRISNLLPPKEKNPSVASLEEALDEEILRVFPGGSTRLALNRSDLVPKIVKRILQAGQIESIWTRRDGLPGGRMGRDIDILFVEHATLDFLREKLLQSTPEESSKLLALLADTGFYLDNHSSTELLPEIFEMVADLPEGERSVGYAAIVELYRGLPIHRGDGIFPKILAALGSGDAGALYHLGPLLASREPEVARKALPDASRLFALVQVDQANQKRVSGEARLRRLATDYAFAGVLLVLQKTENSGTFPEIRRIPVKVPTSVLSRGQAGEWLARFSATFDGSPLPAGTWRGFLEAPTRATDRVYTWRSGATQFQVGP